MYYGARGIVGLVKPTYRPGSMESFIKLMPEGVGFIPAHAGIRAGNEQELQEALTVAEKKVARLAELGADVVMIMGAPPTMVRGTAKIHLNSPVNAPSVRDVVDLNFTLHDPRRHATVPNRSQTHQ